MAEEKVTHSPVAKTTAVLPEKVLTSHSLLCPSCGCHIYRVTIVGFETLILECMDCAFEVPFGVTLLADFPHPEPWGFA